MAAENPLLCSQKPLSSLQPSFCTPTKQGLAALPTCRFIPPHHVCSQSTFLPHIHLLLPRHFSQARWCCQPCPSSQDSKLKLLLCCKVLMAASNQLRGLLRAAKQMEAEAELITKQGLRNLCRLWPEEPRLFPGTSERILGTSAGDG